MNNKCSQSLAISLRRCCCPNVGSCSARSYRFLGAESLHVALDRIAHVKSEKRNYPICIGLGPGSLLWPKKTSRVELMTQYIFPFSEKNHFSKKNEGIKKLYKIDALRVTH